MNKRPKLPFKRERLKMKLWLKKKERIYITYKPSVNQLNLQVKLKLRLRLWLNSLTLKVRLR
jgi:hypothetical protein